MHDYFSTTLVISPISNSCLPLEIFTVFGYTKGGPESKALFGRITGYREKKGSFFMKVTENTIIGDILDADFEVAPYFLEMGMHCLGCPSSRGETVAQACEVHGVDAAELVEKLNAHFTKK